MQENFVRLLTEFIEFIKTTIDGIKLYLLAHPVEVSAVVVVLIVGLILLLYLPKILLMIYKDIIQLSIILLRWVVIMVIISSLIWLIASFYPSCQLLNQHLGTSLKCEKIENANKVK